MPPLPARDTLGTVFVVTGAALAAAATTLPVLEATGINGQFSVSTLELLPLFTMAKLAALALLVASLFVGALARFRVVFGAAAVIMVFVPAVSAFLSAVYAWGTVRAEIVQVTGVRNPFVHPAEAAAAICAAALLVTLGLWRLTRHAPVRIAPRAVATA